MKKTFKFLISLMIVFCVFAIQNYSIYAEGEKNFDSIKDGMKPAVSLPSGGTDKGLGKVINTAIGLIQLAGTGVSLIVITICGIKYMLASAQEKADVKKQLVPIVIGCVLLLVATNIVGIIAETATSAGLTAS